jgi:hypothetical protein
MLVNPNTPVTETERRGVQAGAQAIAQQLVISDVSSERDIETAFASFVQHGTGALRRAIASARGSWPAA